jgi:hypothetical protein
VTDFNDPSPWEQAAERDSQEHQRRRKRRAHLRTENHQRPRCAGCEGDMLVFSACDVFTEEQLQDVYGYLNDEFRPGDILCFWCWNDLTECGENFGWGHA